MKKVIPSLFCLLQMSICISQYKSKLLSVGDIVPDIEISNILNYSSATAKISDFKGKLLILDFWATWCSPCIASFPKLQSLQSKFSDKIQILAVTEEAKEIVSTFFERMKKAKKLSVPISVTGDKKLNRLFSHTTVPHYVWINENGKIIAITGSEDVTEENINTYFRDGTFNYTLKQDESGRIVGQPKFWQSVTFEKDSTSKILRLDSSKLTIHSVLTRYIEGILGAGQFAPDDYLFWGNCSILRLYKTAFYGNGFRTLNASPSVVKVDIEDSILYGKITCLTPDGKELTQGRLETLAWLRENGYCYELKVPPALINQKYKIMLGQLNLYFGAMYGIEGRIEKRMNKYLALVRTSNNNKIEAIGEGEEQTIINSFYLKMQNSTMKRLVSRLVLPLQLYPMIEDETGFTGKISLELNCQLADLKALNNELSKYDLQIVEKEKLMDVGVIQKTKQ